MNSNNHRVFISLRSLNARERRAAAVWCLERFDYEDFDIWSPNGLEPGFWFSREQDAVLFSLRWANA